MRFIVDESTRPLIAKGLQSKGLETFSVFDNSPGISDEEIIKKAFVENWIVITNDKDFGELVFKQKLPHHGIILMRLSDERKENKMVLLEILLNQFSGNLTDKFTVISDNSIRIVP